MKRDDLLIIALAAAALILVPHGLLPHSQGKHGQLWTMLVPLAAVTCAVVGRRRLLQTGHRRLAREMLFLPLLVLYVPLASHAVSGVQANVLLYAMCAVAASLLPLAWFMERRRGGSSGSRF